MQQQQTEVLHALSNRNLRLTERKIIREKSTRKAFNHNSKIMQDNDDFMVSIIVSQFTKQLF